MLHINKRSWHLKMLKKLLHKLIKTPPFNLPRPLLTLLLCLCLCMFPSLPLPPLSVVAQFHENRQNRIGKITAWLKVRRFTYPGCPLASMWLARVTSLDHTSNCHLCRPMSPHRTAPVWIPTLISTLWPVLHLTRLWEKMVLWFFLSSQLYSQDFCNWASPCRIPVYWTVSPTNSHN